LSHLFVGLAETVYIRSNIRFSYRDFIEYTAYMHGFGQPYLYGVLRQGAEHAARLLKAGFGLYLLDDTGSVPLSLLDWIDKPPFVCKNCCWIGKPLFICKNFCWIGKPLFICTKENKCCTRVCMRVCVRCCALAGGCVCVCVANIYCRFC